MLTLACGWAAPVAAELYRWVDEHGRVHYGDHVPPQSAIHGRDIMNGSGRVTKSVPGAISAQDREALRLRREQEELERLAREEQERKDRVLLMTFATERDLRIAHEERIRMYDTTVRLLERKVGNLTERLLDLEKEVAKFEAKDREVPDHLVKDLGSLSRQVLETTTYLDQKRLERQEIVDRFEADLARYRELKTRERALETEAAEAR
jgi:hypothetical protein